MSETLDKSKVAAGGKDDIEQSLYARRQKIYPREVHGMFAWMRSSTMLLLLGLYYGLAWLQWNGQHILLFDLPARKFYIFGLVFWPQDFFFMVLMLIIAALALFFFTSMAGRLWCGYACPQTVWTEIFLWFERKIEGDRPRQMKLDKAPWTGRKLFIKGSKQFVWLLFSLWTGFTFVGYFTPIRELWVSFFTWELGSWEVFWIFFYGFATYGNAGWMREQVCIYMCPYARFQAAMFDKDTLVIGYDEKRGEPRGSRKRGADPAQAGLGSCIDCTLCVQVCPTGIDIRDGMQYECIACAACIDVCDEVMDKMGYARGLVRYTTEHAVQGQPSRFLRPRMFVYIVLLGLLTLGLSYGLLSRVALHLDVIRDRNALYRETPQGLVENVYTLRLVNMDEKPHEFSLTVTGVPGVHLDMDRPNLYVRGGAVSEFAVRVQVDPDQLTARSTRVDFHLSALDEAALSVTNDARFLGPIPNL